MFDIEIYKSLGYLDNKMEWRKWMKEIPYIQFPSDLKVKAIPAFGGAIIRYQVADLEEKASVSIYLDCYDILGLVGEPYWEIYPHDGDTYRVLMNDTEELVLRIKEAIEIQLNEK